MFPKRAAFSARELQTQTLAVGYYDHRNFGRWSTNIKPEIEIHTIFGVEPRTLKPSFANVAVLFRANTTTTGSCRKAEVSQQIRARNQCPIWSAKFCFAYHEGFSGQHREATGHRPLALRGIFNWGVGLLQRTFDSNCLWIVFASAVASAVAEII